MREVAELFKEKGIPFSPRTFDAYLRGISLEKKDNHILNALKAYSIIPGDDKLYPFFGRDRGGFSVNGLVIVSGKEGKVSGTRDNDNEHVFSTLTPKDIVFDFTFIPLSELAEALGDFFKKHEFEPGLSNVKSQGRKVVDQLYNRGMDNIVSDEELKNA